MRRPSPATWLRKTARSWASEAGSLAAGRADGDLKPAPWMFSADLAANDASLRSLAGRVVGGSATALAFGHTGPLEGLEPLVAFATRRD